jgi:hypothetical protein
MAFEIDGDHASSDTRALRPAVDGAASRSASRARLQKADRPRFEAQSKENSRL